jgi:hypothetical protein
VSATLTPPRGSSAPVAGARTTTTAIVVATGPMATGPVLERLLGQLYDLGVTNVHVITRAMSPDAASDLRAIAAIARESGGGVVVLYGDIVTHREAIAGLLADPRIVNGILVARGRRRLAFGTRMRRGVIVSAGSAFHRAHLPDTAFLGVLKVDATRRELLAATAERLAPLAADPPASWEAELERREHAWREAGDEDPALRRALARQDVVSLLVVGLVRADVELRSAPLRGMFWTRATSQQVADEAAAELPDVDEDKVLLDSAVKPVDGFFTTFFVSPYSRYLARWAARRGLTPNQVTAASFVLGILSAACFATGERWGLIAGAILLQVAFTTDCVDGQLARYTRQFSQLGAWLDATFDRSKEYLVFAGLAIGADRAGHPVWVLAAAALTLQTMRHTFDFSWHGARRQRVEVVVQPPIEQSLDAWGTIVAERRAGAHGPPGPGSGGPTRPAAAPGALARWRDLDDIPGVAWVKRVVAFPIGERFALISITAAIWSARTTFIAWLVWGGFAATYGFLGRVLRSLKLKLRTDGDPTLELESFRDDGPIARALGPLGRPVPAPLLATAAVVPLVAAMAIRGDDASNGLAVAVIAWLVLVAGLSGGRTGTSRVRWMVPPLLRVGEYAGLLWLGTLAGASSEPAAFALLAALTLRHYDIVYGLRYRGAPVSDRLGVAAGGWDGRLALGCVLLVTGGLPAGFYVLAAIIAVVFSTAAIRDWSRARMPVTFHDDKEDEDA